MVFCGLVTAECLNRFKRRKLLLFSSIGATISLLIFSIAGAQHVISFFPQLKYLALVGLFGYVIFYGQIRFDILIFFFSLGLGSISFFIGTELVPLQYRSSTFCVSFSLNNVLIVLTSLCVQPAYEVNLYLLYWKSSYFQTFGSLSFGVIFVLPSILAIIYVNANLPETKNKETHQIVEALRRRTGFLKRRNFKGVNDLKCAKKVEIFVVDPQLVS